VVEATSSRNCPRKHEKRSVDEALLFLSGNYGRAGSLVFQYDVVGVGVVEKRALTAHSRPAL
jgi:hypothetical protein